MSDKGKNLIKNNKGKRLYIETAPRGIRLVDVRYRERRFQQKQVLEKQKRLERIMQVREENPVSTECPKCGGVREIYRFTGVVRCPFCDSVEMLPEVHKFIPELDDPKKKLQKPPQIQQPKQMTNVAPKQNKESETFAVLSEIMGFISLFFVADSCELAIVGLIFGVVAQIMIKKNPIGRVALLDGKIGIALNLIAIFLYSLISCFA
ncbi:MAG: DUF4190 domain-containing protein [Ruminococcus sp.]|nr:DUF4190 domain-containing protein [Ruminococcus sp.]